MNPDLFLHVALDTAAGTFAATAFGIFLGLELMGAGVHWR